MVSGILVRMKIPVITIWGQGETLTKAVRKNDKHNFKKEILETSGGPPLPEFKVD